MAKARLNIEDFGGEIPRRSDYLLPASFAAATGDVDLLSGDLRSLHALRELNTFQTHTEKAFLLSDPRAITSFRALENGNDTRILEQNFDSRVLEGVDSVWIGYPRPDVYVLRGPVKNDIFQRHYQFGAGVAPMYNTLARIQNGDPWYLLGVPAPVTAPVVIPSGGSGVNEERAYTYTFVSAFGEESAPAIPTTLTGREDDVWALSSLETTLPDISQRDIQTKRIYRTVSGFTNTSFFFVAEIPLADTTYNDSALSTVVSRNSILESATWNPPPNNLEGAIIMPNGFFVGWAGRDIYPSEGYRPHAWPQAYVQSSEFEIVGMGVYGQIAGVVTVGSPYSLSGTAPATLSLGKHSTVEPGLSEFSIVSTPYGVLYAGQEGLILLSSQGVKRVTQGLMTKDEWNNNYSPRNIVAAQNHTQYLAFYAPNKGFMIDPSEPKSSFTSITGFDNVDYVQTDPFDGSVYLLRKNIVNLWDPFDMPRVNFRWKSKKFRLPQPVNFGAIEIVPSEISGPLDADSAKDIFNWNASRMAVAPLDTIGGNAAIGEALSLSATIWVPPLLYTQNFSSIGGSPLIDDFQADLSSLRTRLNVYADDKIVFTTVISDYKPLKMPSGFKSKNWQFEILGPRVISAIKVSETMQGLSDV